MKGLGVERVGLAFAWVGAASICGFQTRLADSPVSPAMSDLQRRIDDLMRREKEVAIEIGAADKTDKSKKSEKGKEDETATWKKGPPPADLNLVALEARCGIAVGETVHKRIGGLTCYPTEVTSYLVAEDRVLLRFPGGIVAAGVAGTTESGGAGDDARTMTVRKDGGGRRKRPFCETDNEPEAIVKPKLEEQVASKPGAMGISGVVGQVLKERRKAREEAAAARGAGAAATQPDKETKPGDAPPSLGPGPAGGVRRAADLLAGGRGDHRQQDAGGPVGMAGDPLLRDPE